MLAEIVIGIVFSLLLLFILGGLMAIYDDSKMHFTRIASIQALSVKILVALTDTPIEKIENIAQCSDCFDGGTLCEKHELEARKALKLMEESK